MLVRRTEVVPEIGQNQRFLRPRSPNRISRAGYGGWSSD